MAEVQAVKDLDKVKLISYLLEKRYSKQMADIHDDHFTVFLSDNSE